MQKHMKDRPLEEKNLYDGLFTDESIIIALLAMADYMVMRDIKDDAGNDVSTMFDLCNAYFGIKSGMQGWEFEIYL